MGISKISIDDDYCVLDNILAIHLPAGGYLAENGEVYSPDDVLTSSHGFNRGRMSTGSQLPHLRF